MSAVTQTREPPKPVRRATVLMFILSVLYLFGYVLGAAGFVAGGLALQRHGDAQGKALTAMGVGIGVAVLVILGVFLWLTVKVRHGHNWARVVSTVLLSFGLVVTVLDAWRSLAADPVVVPLTGLVEIALMLISLLLLWMPESARAYFAAPRG